MKNITINERNFQDVIATYGYDEVVEAVGVSKIQECAINKLAPILRTFANRDKADIDSTSIMDFFESQEGQKLATLAGLKKDMLPKVACDAACFARSH